MNSVGLTEYEPARYLLTLGSASQALAKAAPSGRLVLHAEVFWMTLEV